MEAWKSHKDTGCGSWYQLGAQRTLQTGLRGEGERGIMSGVDTRRISKDGELDIV